MLPWAQAAISTTWDYEVSTVGRRVTVTTTSALVIIDSTTTRWKATRTGSLKSTPPPQWIINWFSDFKAICELNATRTGHSRPQPCASFLELLIYGQADNMPSSGIKLLLLELFEVLGIEWITQNIESLLLKESSRRITTFGAVWGARSLANNSKLREPLNDGYNCPRYQGRSLK